MGIADIHVDRIRGPTMRATAPAATALLLATIAASAFGFAGHILVYSPWNSPGLRVVNIETGSFVNLSSSGVDRPVFSPDGRKVAFVSNGEICFVNNDGTGFQQSGHSYTTGGLGYNYLTWNTDAIYYNNGRGQLFRYDLTTRTATRIYNDSALGSQAGSSVLGYDQGAWVSSDGTKGVMWTYRDLDPFHGANVLLQFSANWSSYTRRFTHIWGHGWVMSRDGQHVVINSIAGGRTHRAWDVYSFERDSLLYSTPAPTGSGDISTGGLHYVANANDYVAFLSGNDTASTRAYIQNWKTGAFTQVHTSFTSLVTNKWLIRIGGGWLGALPSPTATTPEITLNQTNLNFTSTSTQNVSVTNTGSGTLTKVSAAVSPASPWLTVTVQGSGGNTQAIANAVSATGLADGSYAATVTISGGGASNTAQYNVQLTVGTGIAAPTSLSATVGGATARTVTLNWTDNATNETGYSLERNKSGGSWSVIKTLAAGATTYADTALDTGLYNYRVRAVRTSTYSAYSNSVTATVQGLPAITLTSPTMGMVVTDSVLHIRWSAHLITNVAILYSLNGGDNYTNINPTGGITDRSQEWGDFVWHLPATINSDNVIVWVHQYGAPGFGMYSGEFSIHRGTATHSDSRVVPVIANVRIRGSRVEFSGMVGTQTQVLTLSGAVVAPVALDSRGYGTWFAPRAGTYLVRYTTTSGTTRVMSITVGTSG